MGSTNFLQDLWVKKVVLPASVKSPQDPEAFEVRLLKDEADLSYRIHYHAMTTHRPVSHQIRLPLSFYEKRKHLYFSESRLTNHDLLSFWLFTRILDEIPKPVVTVGEFGVWRGAFIENLAIHAAETGKRLIIYGFDTFDVFPDRSSPKDLATRPSVEKYRYTISVTQPFTQEAIRRQLLKYPSIEQLHLVPGDLTRLAPQPLNLDLAHLDIDLYEPLKSAFRWIAQVPACRVLVDDYYQPSWAGIVDAVNEFCADQRLVPVNLADFYRVPRSYRTQWIVRLLPMPNEEVSPLFSEQRVEPLHLSSPSENWKSRLLEFLSGDSGDPLSRGILRLPGALLRAGWVFAASRDARLAQAVFHLKQLGQEGYYHNIELSRGWTTYRIGGRRWNRQFNRDDASGVLWRLIHAQIGSWEGRRVVDIGPAEGYFTLEAARAGARATAIHPPHLFVSRMRRLLRFHRLEERVEIRIGCYPQVGRDAVGRADVVLCLGLLYHLADLVEALEPMRGSKALWVIESIFHAADAPKDPSGITVGFSPRGRPENRPLCPVWLKRHLNTLGYSVTWLDEWQAFAELPNNGRWQVLGDFHPDREPLRRGVTRRLLVARPGAVNGMKGES